MSFGLAMLGFLFEYVAWTVGLGAIALVRFNDRSVIAPASRRSLGSPAPSESHTGRAPERRVVLGSDVGARLQQTSRTIERGTTRHASYRRGSTFSSPNLATMSSADVAGLTVLSIDVILPSLSI